MCSSSSKMLAPLPSIVSLRKFWVLAPHFPPGIQSFSFLLALRCAQGPIAQRTWMPNGQPLFLDNSSALTRLLLCFPSFDYPGWATCKEIECSLSLFSYEMTALFLKVPCSSLVPSECGRHVRRTALNASSGPQPVILVLQSQRCDFYTRKWMQGRGRGGTLCLRILGC